MKSYNNLSLNSDDLNAANDDEFKKAAGILEFDKVLEKIAGLCPVEDARRIIMNTSPSVSANEIKTRLAETSEAKALIQVKSKIGRAHV